MIDRASTNAGGIRCLTTDATGSTGEGSTEQVTLNEVSWSARGS